MFIFSNNVFNFKANMSLLENPENIKLLKSLLYQKVPSDASDSEEEDCIHGRNVKYGPADIETCNNSSKSTTETKRPEENIEQWLARQEKEDNEILETRTCPEYKISYEQSVGTEDIFLRMNNKTPSTFSCENIIIEVHLPNETAPIHDMDISLATTEIDLQTPKYRLKLPLANTIDPDKGSAKYDSDKNIMKLTLVLKRELDFVNF